jgi:hypothetical protein
MASDALVFAKALKKLPHFTAMCCFNRFGEGPSLDLVIPGVRHTPAELRQFAEMRFVNFHASRSGWAVEAIFVAFAIRFCEWLAVHRQCWGLEANLPAVLFLDGAWAHISLRAMRIFIENNAVAVILVAHCTHILQPVDTGFALAFKRLFTGHYRRLSTAAGLIERLSGVSTRTGWQGSA